MGYAADLLSLPTNVLLTPVKFFCGALMKSTICNESAGAVLKNARNGAMAALRTVEC